MFFFKKKAKQTEIFCVELFHFFRTFNARKSYVILNFFLMNYSERSDQFENFDSFDDVKQYPTACPWCTPCKVSVKVETCFAPPKVQDNPISRPIPTSTNSGEKFKRCDFEYLPGIFFKQRIIIH